MTTCPMGWSLLVKIELHPRNKCNNCVSEFHGSNLQGLSRIQKSVKLLILQDTLPASKLLLINSLSPGTLQHRVFLLKLLHLI